MGGGAAGGKGAAAWRARKGGPCRQALTGACWLLLLLLRWDLCLLFLALAVQLHALACCCLGAGLWLDPGGGGALLAAALSPSRLLAPLHAQLGESVALLLLGGQQLVQHVLVGLGGEGK